MARRSGRAETPWAAWGSAVSDVFEALVPAPCIACSGPQGPICPACRLRHAEELTPRPREVSDAAPALPIFPDRGMPPVWAGGSYSGLLSSLMLAYKSGGVTALSEDLGPFLEAALRAAVCSATGTETVLETGPVAVVPVPGRRSAFLTRGFDPLSLLIEQTGAARVLPALEHRPALPSLRPPAGPGARTMTLRSAAQSSGQKGLGARQRAERRSGSLRVVPGWGQALREAACVVVVDDVLTTGATLGAAFRALTPWTQAPCVGAVALAAGRVHRGQPGIPR